MQNPSSNLFNKEWFSDYSKKIFEQVVKHDKPMSKRDMERIRCAEYYNIEVTENINYVRENLIKYALLREANDYRYNLYESLVEYETDEHNPMNNRENTEWYENASLEEIYERIKAFNRLDDDYNNEFTARYIPNTATFCIPSELPNAKEEVNWLVDGMIMQNTFNEIVSSQKTGKTQLAYLLAASVANGVPFLKHNTIQKDVLYVDFEMKNFEIYRRTKWLQEFMGIKEYKSFKVMGVASAPETNLEYILNAVKREKEANDGINLVIFDNFYSMATDIDTNKLSDVIGKLKQIVYGVGDDMTIILVNHTNKAVTRRKNSNPSFNEIMSSAFGSNAHGMFTSSVLYMEKKNDGVDLYTAGRYINKPECIHCFHSEETHWFFKTAKDVAEGLSDSDYMEIDDYLNSKSRNRLSKLGTKKWDNFKNKFGDKYNKKILKEAGYIFETDGKHDTISVRTNGVTPLN